MVNQKCDEAFLFRATIGSEGLSSFPIRESAHSKQSRRGAIRPGRPPWQFAPKVFIRARRRHSAARRAVNQPELHQVRLLHLLQGGFFPPSRRPPPSHAPPPAPPLFPTTGHPRAGPR